MTWVNTIDLYKAGLIETMCFQKLDQANYWYIKDNYLYHSGRISLHRKLLDQTLHRRRLDQTIINVYSSTVWENVYE